MPDEESAMMDFIGIKNSEELFSDIPVSVRKGGIPINKGISEFEVMKLAEEIGSANRGFDFANFMGCGIYDRIIPAAVDSIIGRSEFITSYTPYQAEFSQGMLQSLFEYQSLISDLMGMDMTNSSIYDGATALGEAVRMAHRINEKNEVLIPENIYRSKMDVIHSYSSGLNLKFIKYSFRKDTGCIDLDDLSSKITTNTSAIVCENPNSFGIIDPNVSRVQEIKKDALLISYVDPISLGAIAPPGSYGADISVGEGQQLGIHRQLGGPLLGLFSFRKEYLRKSPGRIIGLTSDVNGKRSFVMTIQTREQHIRREKATSNICSNQALMALASAVYLSIVGSDGLRKIANVTISNAKKLRNTISKIKGYNADLFSGTSFSDVIVKMPADPVKVQKQLYEKGILGPVPSAMLFPDLVSFRKAGFFSVTEKNTDKQINNLAKALEAIR
ncbi:MAG: aminomethyl-transferring glycine dehydrogenase subunit GcvPA [Thermoplasmataceae archaeon]